MGREGIMGSNHNLWKSIGAGLALTLATAGAQANLIVNGGFETPDIDTVVGERGSTSSTWQYYNASEVEGFEGSNIELWNSGFNGVESFEGEQFLELNSHPTPGSAFSIFQEFDTVAGQSYNVSFAYRARANDREMFNVDLSSAGGFSLLSENVDDH